MTMQRAPDTLGLCARCRFLRVLISAKQSSFVFCLLSRQRPEYPKYPRLPVLTCAGFSRAPDAGPTTTTSTHDPESDLP